MDNQEILDILNGMQNNGGNANLVNGIVEGMTPRYEYREQIQQDMDHYKPKQDVAGIVSQMINPLGEYARNSDQYYQDVFNQVYKSGATEAMAHEIAREKTAPYQANRIAAMTNVFNQAGVDNGQITNTGVSMLSQIGYEDPAQANFLANMYGTPKTGYAFKQDLARQNNTAANSLNNAAQMAGINFDYSQRGAEASLRRKMQLDAARAQLAADARRQQAAEAYQAVMALGGSEQAAQEAYFGTLLGGRGTSSRGNNNNGEASDKDDYKRTREWIKDYESRYMIPGTGQFVDGRGPDDPEYADRMERYNNYTSTQYDPTNYDDEMRFAQRLVASGKYTDDAIKAYIKENFADADAVINDLGLR